jgi:hypothetical protein
MRACFNNSSITLTTLTHLLNQNQIILTENQLLKVQNEEILRRLEFTVDQNSWSMAKIQQILVKFFETSKSIFETSKTIYDQSQDNLKFQQQLQYQASTIQKLQQIFFRNSPPSLLLLEYLYLLLITRLWNLAREPATHLYFSKVIMPKLILTSAKRHSRIQLHRQFRLLSFQQTPLICTRN